MMIEVVIVRRKGTEIEIGTGTENETAIETEKEIVRKIGTVIKMTSVKLQQF